MFKLWDTYTTKDKVLAVLCDVAALPATEKIAAVQAKFPHLSHEDIISIIWHLERERFVRIFEDRGVITSIAIHHSARSFLMSKEENKYSLLKWDIVKLLLGYALGFLSACLSG